jgi:hypothetical protein
MKVFRSIGVLVVAVLVLSGCSGSDLSTDSAEVNPESIPTEQTINLEAKRMIKLKSAAYIDYNCSPKYYRQVDDGSLFGSNIKQMDVYNLEILGADQLYLSQQKEQYFLVNDANDSTYGNFAVRTLYLVSLYHWHLSGLYSHIYDIYSSEMKGVRKDFTRFRIIADKAALKICGVAKQNLESETLEAPDVAKVQAVYDELEANWVSFNSWIEAVTNLKEDISSDIDAYLDEVNTPTCNEYPTADGKYVVVKCTFP